MKLNPMMAAGLILFLGLSLAVPMAARASNLVVKNDTAHCAWVTVYTAYGMTRFEIVSDEHGRPRFVRPGIAQQFMLPLEPEMKARAEIMRNPDCSGGTIADVYDVKKGLNVHGWYNANIVKVGDRFWINIK